MKKTFGILLVAAAVLIAGALSIQARSRFNVNVSVGPGFLGSWGLGYPYPYYYPYYSPPVVVQQPPPVVIQQPPQTYVQQAPPPVRPQYWYFCREASGYYPYVKRCPGGWMKVVPQTTPPDTPPE